MDENRKSYQRQYRADYKSKVKRVNLTLTNSEYRMFSRSAEVEKTKITAYIKKLAVAGLEGQAHIPAELNEELKALRFAVLNIANNVNQIAHHSNTVKQLANHEEHNLLQHLKQLDEAVRAYTSGQILSKTEDHDN